MGVYEFADKTVVVTGAGSGLGREVAVAFAESGATLVLVDISAESLAETSAIISALGVRVIALTLDISSATNCAQVIDTAVRTHGRLDALCNVAGILQMTKAHDITAASWDRVLGVNLSGPFFMCQEAIPHLIKTRGAIVNVASAAAFHGQPYMVAYAASKAGLVNMTKSLAVEFIKQPIRINAVAPGAMNTNMAKTALPPGLDADLIGMAAGIRAASDPREIAEVIVFLASERAQGVHGACFNVDNGRTAI
jgi:NAD(P)-dependent dehydrogenase (short-subunit alcohol dehydrogenase family)